jgi:hypothetical protein
MSTRIPRRGPYRPAAARQAGARLCRLAAVRSSATGGPGFFTLALPVLFLVIFALVFTGTTKVAGGSIDTSLYYVPGIITLAIISAAFGNLGPRPGPLLLHT